MDCATAPKVLLCESMFCLGYTAMMTLVFLGLSVMASRAGHILGDEYCFPALSEITFVVCLPRSLIAWCLLCFIASVGCCRITILWLRSNSTKLEESVAQSRGTTRSLGRVAWAFVMGLLVLREDLFSTVLLSAMSTTLVSAFKLIATPCDAWLVSSCLVVQSVGVPFIFLVAGDSILAIVAISVLPLALLALVKASKNVIGGSGSSGSIGGSRGIGGKPGSGDIGGSRGTCGLSTGGGVTGVTAAGTWVEDLAQKDIAFILVTEKINFVFLFPQKFDVWPGLVRVDYMPCHVDLAALRGGVELQLKHVHAVGVYGWGSMHVHKLLRGLPPIKSLVAVASSAAKLTFLACEELQSLECNGFLAYEPIPSEPFGD
ncbi:hypothetical protein RHSIM_Rhsim11G0175200 [Rhododendron simsii]|uniref:Autophagy-related protein 2 n=1 Tax=Rhododendron simsii TaxID=118357 RepID=A0A834G9X0_RHOSS|nr:hypothetical protein RHSIM_Rhsim11G0175200 [Rhododendron simsii]